MGKGPPAIIDALAGALPAETVNSAIARVFDAEAYFSKVSIALCHEAIDDAWCAANPSFQPAPTRPHAQTDERISLTGNTPCEGEKQGDRRCEPHFPPFLDDKPQIVQRVD
jgi:hypothetical protein